MKLKRCMLFVFAIFVGVFVVTFLGRKQARVFKKSTLANIEALASSESDIDRKVETKVEEEEALDYEEVHGKCIFLFTVKIITTSCYGVGNVDCIPNVEIGEPELISVDCSD